MIQDKLLGYLDEEEPFFITWLNWFMDFVIISP